MIGLIFLSIAIAFLTHSLSIRHFFTGDTLYLSALFRDFFEDGGSFFDWYLPGAPYFFPDMALYFPIKAIFSDTYFSALIYALLQAGIAYLLVLWLIRILPVINEPKSKEHIIQNRFDIFLGVFLVAIACLAIRNHSDMAAINIAHIPYFRILTSVFHFGNITNMLVAVALILLLIERKKAFWGYPFLFLISALAASSDALFIVGYTVPSAIAIALICATGKLSRLRALSLVFVPLLGAATGVLLKAALTIDTTSSYILRKNDLLGQLSALSSVIWLSFRDMPIVMMLLFLFYGILLWKTYQGFTSEIKLASHLYLYSFILISILCTIAALIINGVLVAFHYGSSRYFLNFYWFPVLFSWLIADVFPYAQRSRPKYIRNTAFLVVLLISSYSAFPRGEFHGGYKPPIVQCIDRGLKDYTTMMNSQVQHGIASYWPASLVNEFSGLGLAVVQVQPDLSPAFWVNNVTRYRSEYDFAVVEILPDREIPDSETLKRINGEPNHEFSCKDDQAALQILVYGKGQLQTEPFVNVGDGYTWQACELPVKETGIAQENCSVTTKPALLPGLLTFGPYVSVPEGEYRFNIRYFSPATSTEKIGDWDVIVASPEKAEQLQQGSMVGTNGRDLEISGSFNISKEYADGNVEIRTISNGSNALTVIEITLTRVG